jgi:phospholipid/cholesterol/gamma-HCH transport system ATP-binding protein
MNAPESSHRQGVKVEVQGLRKSYNGQEVLRGLNFEVKPGEVFVVMGPSGSGKSVLLKQLIGLEQPDSGRILIEGEMVRSNGFARPYRAAMVFQSCALLHCLSVGANVGLHLEEHTNTPSAEISRIVSHTLELVGLKGIENRMPSELSEGMRKRVAIARALVVEPQLILYDKPTCGLDPVASVEIAEIIVELGRRIHVTSVVVSHDRNLAFSVADRIAVMEDGNIIAVRTPCELRRDPDPRIQNFLNVHFDHPEGCNSFRQSNETASWHSTNYTGEQFLAGAA